jgi:hypothetical protein
LKKNNVKQILAEAVKPQSNGMIERANVTIKELIEKSIINNSQRRITGFTPNEIQKTFKNDDKDVLDKAYNTELKKKKPNISKEVFEVGDLVRRHEPSDKTR